jgi:hypothetical protein
MIRYHALATYWGVEVQVPRDLNLSIVWRTVLTLGGRYSRKEITEQKLHADGRVSGVLEATMTAQSDVCPFIVIFPCILELQFGM